MGGLWLDLLTTAFIATYIVWGFTFAIHSLLILHKSKTAILWARKWYTPKGFMIETYVFSPIIYIAYFLFEVMPGMIGISDEVLKLDFDQLVQTAFYDTI